MARELPGLKISHDDALGVAVDHDEIEHFAMGEKLHGSRGHQARKGGVGAEEKLLAGLAARVERARDLGAAEGPVVEQAAVLPREGHSLGHALVDDVHRDLGQPVGVGLARAIVPTLDRVVEEPVDAVAVVLVIFRGVDSALRRDRMRPARAVVKHEAFHLVAEFRQGGRRRGARQAGADDDDLVFALVRRVDQSDRALVAPPFVREGAGRNFGIEPGHR